MAHNVSAGTEADISKIWAQAGGSGGKTTLELLEKLFERETEKIVKDSMEQYTLPINEASKIQSIYDSWALSAANDALVAQGPFHNLPEDHAVNFSKWDTYFDGQLVSAGTQYIHGIGRTPHAFLSGIWDGWKEGRKEKEQDKKKEKEYIYTPGGMVWDANRYWDFVKFVKENYTEQFVREMQAIKETDDPAKIEEIYKGLKVYELFLERLVGEATLPFVSTPEEIYKNTEKLRKLEDEAKLSRNNYATPKQRENYELKKKAIVGEAKSIFGSYRPEKRGSATSPKYTITLNN